MSSAYNLNSRVNIYNTIETFQNSVMLDPTISQPTLQPGITYVVPLQPKEPQVPNQPQIAYVTPLLAKGPQIPTQTTNQQPINQPTNQQPINKPTNQQPINQPTNQPFNQITNLPIVINQPNQMNQNNKNGEDKCCCCDCDSRSAAATPACDCSNSMLTKHPCINKYPMNSCKRLNDCGCDRCYIKRKQTCSCAMCNGSNCNRTHGSNCNRTHDSGCGGCNRREETQACNKGTNGIWPYIFM